MGILIVIAAILLKILAVGVPVALVLAGAWYLFRRSAVGQSVLAQGEDQELLHRLADDVARLEHEVLDLQERLDFAERRLVAPESSLTHPGEPPTPPEPAAVG